jgi:Protein of unknown function (DUF1552)
MATASPPGARAAKISPVALYSRIFGASFVDPNVANFTPDPNVMVRHSVMSAIAEHRQAMMQKVSATDKQRLDEYFTSVRDLEGKLAVELEKPAALPGCKRPEEFEAEDVGSLLAQAQASNKMFAQLITHAMSCGQTRVFNFSMGQGLGSLRKEKEILTYHSLTHEEPVDPVLGYQVKCKLIAELLMDNFRELIMQMDSVKEGEGTLLDRTLVFAFTDHGEPRVHSMQRYPIFTAGSGGGRMKTGYHIAAEGDAATRVGLTLQRAMGVAAGSWGTESNRATKLFSEVLV